MLHRAAQTVFWPGYTADIEKRRAGCHACNTIAPSQQQVPIEQSEPRTTPFESIAADFFDLAGVHYLVTIDSLLGWLNVTRAAPGSAGSGAKGLELEYNAQKCINTLLQYYNIANELYSC